MTFPTRIAFDDARRIVAEVAAARRLPAERVALANAHGRALASDLVATIDQPGFDNSAMDGFALRHADLADAQGLRLIGEQFAGRALDWRIGPGESVRITTGAPLPAGADTVLIKENARIDGERVHALSTPMLGQHVRRAGEDVRVGDALLSAGQTLTPSRIALAAGQGIDRLEVVRRPTVAVFTTGDELIEPGLPLRPGELYDSNRSLLMGLLRADGFEPVAWPRLPDDLDAMLSALRHAGHAFDVVVTCGGVSAGEKDHLPALLQREGHVHFWKVRMKPGMPVLFAESAPETPENALMQGEYPSGSRKPLGEALFLCLPGNPVSVLATYLTLGRALLDGLQGRSEPRPRLRARLRSAWRKRHERLEFLRGRLECDEGGQLWVEPNPADGSHRMRAAADSDALIVLGEGEIALDGGAVVDVLTY
ncbi:MAG: molybdopterin molybdotransferase MoeA [Lysobacter sp.]|nr:MAG: molybdopterin molybdotransferase MoeA [Lysobacter sp.]